MVSAQRRGVFFSSASAWGQGPLPSSTGHLPPHRDTPSGHCTLRHGPLRQSCRLHSHTPRVFYLHLQWSPRQVRHPTALVVAAGPVTFRSIFHEVYKVSWAFGQFVLHAKALQRSFVSHVGDLLFVLRCVCMLCLDLDTRTFIKIIKSKTTVSPSHQ